MPSVATPRVSPEPDIMQNIEAASPAPSPSRSTSAPPSNSPSRVTNNTPSSARSVKSPTKGKARRKVSVEDALATSTAVQRLVEYFVVVSSQPRWETSSSRLQTPDMKGRKKQNSTGEISNGDDIKTETKAPPKNNNSNKPVETPHRNKRSSSLIDAESLLSPEPLHPPTTKKKIPLGSRFRFRTRENTKDNTDRAGGDDGDEKKEIDGVEPGDSDEAAPPTPRSEWTRDERGSGENIHMPVNDCQHSFQPVITARFPLMDHSDNPLNPMITQFCYPSGEVIVPSRVYELPRVHHFVLTNDKGRKVYGTCLTMFEEYHASEEGPWITRDQIHSEDSVRDIEVTVSEGRTVLYIPKVLCLLSTWPYLTAMREWLAQFYRLASSTNIMQTPIERYVLNICMEIPAPPPGAYEVQVSILNSTIRFWAPPAKLPIAYVALPYQTLFDCLDVENILLLWNALIMEHKILLVSSQYSILTVCSEILVSLLFPMRWCHLYVPLLPRFICPMLDAPVPYLCGVVRENWLYAQQFVSHETIIVDLDRNTVATGEMTPDFVPPPIRKWTKLKAAVDVTAGHLFWKTRGMEEEYNNLMHGRRINLRRNLANLQKQGSPIWKEKLLCYDHAFNLAYTPTSPNLLNDSSSADQQSQWDRVQEAFLRFFVALMKDYRRFLTPPDGNEPGVFNKEDFIASQKPENQPFLAELCETQQFEDYVTKRLYSPGEPDVIFFDQSIDAKLNRSRLKLRKVDTPFLQSAKAHKVLKKVNAVEPSTEDLPLRENGTPYVYTSWPETFDCSLFCEPRPIPRMIAAEFDRQSVLVSRLRLLKYEPCEGVDPEGAVTEDNAAGFLAADYDTSPEIAAFTVFFFTYATLIGRDWQEFQKKRKELALEHPAYGTPIVDVHQNITSPSNDSSETGIKEKESDQEGVVELSGGSEVVSAQCHDDCYVAVCDDCTNPTVGSTLPYTSPFPTKLYSDFKNFSILPSSMMKSNVSDEAKKRPEFVTPNRSDSLVDHYDDTYAEYEEARAVASAQLDLGFATLTTMSSLRKLAPDADAYKSLMGACGRCGDTQRALELIETMKTDGLVDGEVLSWFVSAFGNKDDSAVGGRQLSPANRDNLKTPHRHEGDAYYKYLEKKLDLLEQSRNMHGSASCLEGLLSSDDESSSVFSADSSVSSHASAPVQSASFMVGQAIGRESPAESCEMLFNTLESVHLSEIICRVTDSLYLTLQDWFTPHKKPKPLKKKKSKRKRRKSSIKIGMPVSDAVAKQIVLAENLLDFLYPSLSIDLNGDCCPQCSAELSEGDIVQGWVPCAFSDYTTSCPQCKHRFVPRFAVTNLAPDFQGSQGLGTPLYCEYLSPWVLRKELDAVAKGDSGIEAMIMPEWRSGIDIHSTLWWNMVVLCRKYRLPFTYLLQGSFQNRLISPTP